MKKTLYILGVLVCVVAIVLCCMTCGAPSDNGTTTTSTTDSASTSSTGDTTTAGKSAESTTGTHGDGGVVSPSTGNTIEPSTTTTTNNSSTASEANDSTPSSSTSTGTTTSKTSEGTTTKTTTKASTSTTTTTAKSETPTTTTTTGYPNGFPDVDVEIHEFETYMLELMNADRVKAGLKPLKMSTYYHDCAEIRAKEASVHWGHDRPNGKMWHTVFEEQGKKPYGYTSGENLGDGFTCSKKGVEMIYAALYASSGHKANMMNAQFTEVAIAIYWTKNDDLPTGYSGTVAQLFFGKLD